jgi:tRNA A-37 threonylcarbamoyl transferase component Bud32
MTELFTDEEEQVLNQIPNNLAFQFEEEDNDENEGIEGEDENEEEELSDFRSKLYFRRIVVRDGIIKGNFPVSECSSAGSQNWIPRDFQTFQHNFLLKSKLISSILFESDSHLTRIESKAFSSSSLESILIPRNVEILESKCFSSCESLSSITFESNSCLTRIESQAFKESSLKSIVIPRNVQFIDGSAFIGVTLSSISIESGSEMFVIENDFLIDVLHHKLIRNFSESSKIEIGQNVEILGSKCFSFCKSLSSITFESNSLLTRIESEAFSSSSLESILIPRNVEILGSKCFDNCTSLSSITFESNSRLTRIESSAFLFSSLQSILIPSTILFIASDAIDIASEIQLIDGDSCPEFDRWLELKRSGIAIDFRRIERMGFDIRCLGDYIVNLSVFEARSINCESDEVGNEIYDRIEDDFLIFVKSKLLSDNISESELEKEVEILIHLCHPCIAAPIGFVFGIESGGQRELQIVRMYLEGCSLLEVVSVNPLWWTSTVKAKAVAGIVLGLQFAHSLGLLHGHLTGNNILFDSDHCIQIVNFHPIVLEVGELESDNEAQTVGISGKGWTAERDIEAFASILFELLFGYPPQGEASIPTDIPDFVSRIIKSGFSPISRRSCSFNTILDILKQNNFRIEEGVNSSEVSALVSWVESAQ